MSWAGFAWCWCGRAIPRILVRWRGRCTTSALAALRVVNEFPVPFEAAKSAVDASAVMEDAATYTSVAEAVADCTLVVGTTAVGERDVQHRVADAGGRRAGDAGGMARQANAEEASPRVALLFGSEKTGLSNEELSHCNWLLTIPMHEHEGVRHPSMNLGQAVAVCLYELVRRVRGAHQTPQSGRSASLDGASGGGCGGAGAADGLLIEVMEKTEYTRRHAANSSAGAGAAAGAAGSERTRWMRRCGWGF